MSGFLSISDACRAALLICAVLMANVPAQACVLRESNLEPSFLRNADAVIRAIPQQFEVISRDGDARVRLLVTEGILGGLHGGVLEAKLWAGQDPDRERWRWSNDVIVVLRRIAGQPVYAEKYEVISSVCAGAAIYDFKARTVWQLAIAVGEH